MIFHRFILFVYTLGFILFASSCGKKKLDAELTDWSIPEPIELIDIKKVGNQFIIVGGERYYSSVILRMDDQGKITRETLPSNSSQKAIYGVDISASGRMIAVGYGGAIYHCPQLGLPWTFVQDPSWREFQQVSFSNEDSAVIVGGIVFREGWSVKCDQEGNSSESLRVDRNFEICDVEFVTPTTGYLCGYGAVMQTSNAGQSWNFTSAKNDYFKAMCWKNLSEGIVVGYEGTLLKTSDGGQTWSTKRSGNDFWKKKWHLLNVASNGNDTYACVGESGFVAVSKDQGETWTEIKTNSKSDLKGLVFMDANTLITTGTNGAILKLSIP